MKYSIEQIRLSPFRASFSRIKSYPVLLGVAILVAGFAVGPRTEAVSPPPDGGYPNANTAEGDQALFSLTTGIDNVAVGFNSLFSTTTGSSNAALGFYVMANNTTGNNNTATGVLALQSNTTGSNNTAVGFDALYSSIAGASNTAYGAKALYNNTGDNNIALGANAGFQLTTGNGNIDIGNAGRAGEAGTIRIGKQGVQTAAYIAGVSGATVAGGVGVIVDGNGRLGTVTSSESFKEAIRPMEKASESILTLQPVTFHYKQELDPDGIPQFGLLAEQVAKVNPALVARDERGKPYSVRYEAVNAMLLNEFIKAHRKVEAQAAINRQLKSALARQDEEIRALSEALKKQAAEIQKVSAPQAMDNPESSLVSRR